MYEVFVVVSARSAQEKKTQKEKQLRIVAASDTHLQDVDYSSVNFQGIGANWFFYHQFNSLKIKQQTDGNRSKILLDMDQINYSSFQDQIVQVFGANLKVSGANMFEKWS